jgi:hypothetical protein
MNADSNGPALNQRVEFRVLLNFAPVLTTQRAYNPFADNKNSHARRLRTLEVAESKPSARHKINNILFWGFSDRKICNGFGRHS